MKRLVLVVLAVALAACAAPTAPRKVATKARQDDITCRSGYQIAYRADGTAYCEPVGQQ